MKKLFSLFILFFVSCSQPEDFQPFPLETKIAKVKLIPSQPKDTLHIFKSFPSNHDNAKDFKLFRNNFYIRISKEAEYQKDLNILDKLIEWDTRSFSFRPMDSLINKWRKKNIPPYNTDILLLSCNQIWENTFLEESKKARVISKYLKMVKENFNRLNPETYKKLLELGFFEAENLAQLKAGDFETARKELLAEWLHIGAMWQANIDPNYDPKQMLFMSVGIPPGFEGSDKYCCMSIDPSCIKEPALRQAYKDSILKNSWVITVHNTQYYLRKEYQWTLNGSLRNNIINLYSMPPENITELKTVMNEFILDSAYKKYILDNVYKHFYPEI